MDIYPFDIQRMYQTMNPVHAFYLLSVMPNNVTPVDRFYHEQLEYGYDYTLQRVTRQALEQEADAIIGFQVNIHAFSDQYAVMMANGIAIQYTYEQPMVTEEETDIPPRMVVDDSVTKYTLPRHLQEQQTTIIKNADRHK